MQDNFDITALRDNEKKMLASIFRAITSIRYGSVEITVHDSKVVQIDKTEKIRFNRNAGDYQI